MPIIFLPGRAKGKFVKELINKSRRLMILSALTPAKPIDENDYPLGKALGTVRVSNVVVSTKGEVLSGKINGVKENYAQQYPWESSKLEGTISIWFLEDPEEWSTPLPYKRMPGAQRWIKNVKLKTAKAANY
jgi:hypothetical protein